MEFLLPEIKNPWNLDETDFVRQLKSELGIGHYLISKKLTSIARRHDDDIFLFKIEDHTYKYVVAHLWMGLETTPLLQFFSDEDDLYKNRLSIDERNWEEMENSGL